MGESLDSCLRAVHRGLVGCTCGSNGEIDCDQRGYARAAGFARLLAGVAADIVAQARKAQAKADSHRWHLWCSEAIDRQLHAFTRSREAFEARAGHLFGKPVAAAGPRP